MVSIPASITANDTLDLIEQNPGACNKSETATNGSFTGLKIMQWNIKWNINK